MITENNSFFPQAKLILQSLPYVFEEEVFALKGGSAINFFFRDMPRLSVDIDLTYLPIESREISLEKIERSLKNVAKKIKSVLSNVNIQEGRNKDSNTTSKIFVRNAEAQIKIEPNLVIRGTVFPAEKHILSSKAQEIFELFVEGQTVSLADVFGGKICAALDRQHPRDLYDIKYLLDNEGITEQIRKGFLVYLISHGRPIHELLNPVLKEFRTVYEAEFRGMANDDILYENLVDVRTALVGLIKKILTKAEKDFLVSLKKGEPDWDLLGVKGADSLPAVKWKLTNIRKMRKEKKSEFVKKLEDSLSI